MPAPHEQDLLIGAAVVELRLLTAEQLVSLNGETSGGSLRDRILASGLLSEQQLRQIDQAVQRRTGAPHVDASQTPSIAGDETSAGQTPLSEPTPQENREANDADPFLTQALEPTPIPSQQQRYQLLRPHQRGGLGLVSIARDEDFNREVALKEILPSSADDEQNRRRFIREAEITGALEHPGVVPVYSLGCYDDGRPYYVMRFVHGVDMQQAIASYQGLPTTEKPLRFRQLMGRFVDVCQTIHYAHSRGVLHRDLKPSNIMLGDYGETIVVDWGLAKASGESHSVDEFLETPVSLSGKTPHNMTVAGRVIGTPIYMSPEQAEGRLERFGVTTDVYGLGATLYCLLTGAPPFDPHSSNIPAQVRSGSFTPPRKRSPEISKALEAVCLKAMALKQSDRYPTAGELGLDVERWLADQPVTAYRESLGARAWRWARTHRAEVTSIVAASVVAMAALVAGVVLLSSTNQKISAARDLAEEQRLEAVAQRKRAEKNAELAREAVRDYYVRVSEETLLDQPGMQPLRNDLLRQAMKYYEQFLSESGDDPVFGREVATAHYYIGRITQTIDGPAAALLHLEQAANAQEGLAQREDAAEDQVAEYSRTLNAIGNAYRALNRPDDAYDLYDKALALRQRLAEASPNSPERASELANCVMNIGVLYADNQMLNEALEHMRHAQSIRIAHVDDQGQAILPLCRDLGKGGFNLAYVYLLLEQPDQAASELRQAIEQFQTLDKAEPGDVSTLSQLASCHRALAEVYSKQNKLDASVAEYEQAAELMTRLVMRNPEVPAYAVDLAGVRMNLGDLLVVSGEPEEALVEMLGAIELLDVPPEESPSARQRRDLGVILREAGRLMIELDQPEEGMQRLARSEQVFKMLIREHPGDPEFTAELSKTSEAILEAKTEQQAPEEKAT